MNAFNRMFVLIAAAVAVALMVAVIVLAWTADSNVVDSVADLASYLDDHTDNLSKVILSLGALVVLLLALILIVAELVPTGPVEIRLRQTAGGTLVVAADDIARRIEEEVGQLATTQEVRALVTGRDNGIQVTLELAVGQGANLAAVMEESAQVTQRTVEEQIGVPLVGQPTVRVRYVPSAPAAAPEGPAPTTSAATPAQPSAPEEPSEEPPPSDASPPAKPPRWGA